ncbi:MAG: aromatic-ring-hydroxylating dioxygenase subunit beta [Thermostichus sp. BF3_bins_97]
MVKSLQDWHQAGIPVDSKTQREAEALLFAEARLIDLGQFQEWLNLFVPECLYWAPVVPMGGDPRKQVSLIFDDRRRMEDRVAWLTCGFAYAQTPPSRTCRILGNIEVFQTQREDELRVRSNQIIQEFRVSQSRTFAGWCGHLLRQTSEGWRIVIKQVHLIDCDQGHENLTFLL